MIAIANERLRLVYRAEARLFEVTLPGSGLHWASLPLERRFRVLEADTDGGLSSDRIQLRLYDRDNQADLLATWSIDSTQPLISLALNAFEGNGAALLVPVPYPPLFVAAPAEQLALFRILGAGGQSREVPVVDEVLQLSLQGSDEDRSLIVRSGSADGPAYRLVIATAGHARLEPVDADMAWQLVWLLEEGSMGQALGYTRIVRFDFSL